MKVQLISIGHKAPDWVTDAFTEYQKRLGRNLQLSLVALKPSLNHCRATQKAQEAKKILAKVGKNHHLVALDLQGHMYNSQEFAQKVQIWQNQGQNISLVLGGAYGLCPSLLQQANEVLSFSKLTFPHMLMRVLVAEQIYRAHTINHQGNYDK